MNLNIINPDNHVLVVYNICKSQGHIALAFYVVILFCDQKDTSFSSLSTEKPTQRLKTSAAGFAQMSLLTDVYFKRTAGEESTPWLGWKNSWTDPCSLYMSTDLKPHDLLFSLAYINKVHPFEHRFKA